MTVMRTSELAKVVEGKLHGGDVEVTGLALDSRRVRPGDLFVCVPGTRSTGSAFAADARARGAVAACATEPVEGLPTIVVADARAAAGRLAAAFEGNPAERLTLIGVTGTLGKTSTALLVQSALGASGRGVGVIGSLGVRVRNAGDPGLQARLPDNDGMTTPDAPVLHRAFRLLADAGVRLVAMEVTSHALAQRRVDGLCYALGVITNLVPDEHLEFHGSAEHYLRTKARFFDLLSPGAPIVANADDALVRDMVAQAVEHRPHRVIRVTMEGAEGAQVRARDVRTGARGSSFTLDVVEPIPCLDASRVVEPCTLALALPVFGVQQVGNAALAAVAALVAGASPDGIAAAVAQVEPMRRRMQVLRDAGPFVVDDTSGNPETLRAVFESVRAIPHRRLRLVFGIRGMRGKEINRRLAMTLAGLVTEHAAAGHEVHFVVTASDDAADERNRVLPEEEEAFLGALTAARAPHQFEQTLAGAVDTLLDGVAADDLVLVLGAQGMDTAGAQVGQRLAALDAGGEGAREVQQM